MQIPVLFLNLIKSHSLHLDWNLIWPPLPSLAYHMCYGVCFVKAFFFLWEGASLQPTGSHRIVGLWWGGHQSPLGTLGKSVAYPHRKSGRTLMWFIFILRNNKWLHVVFLYTFTCLAIHLFLWLAKREKHPPQLIPFCGYAILECTALPFTTWSLAPFRKLSSNISVVCNPFWFEENRETFPDQFDSKAFVQRWWLSSPFFRNTTLDSFRPRPEKDWPSSCHPWLPYKRRPRPLITMLFICAHSVFVERRDKWALPVCSWCVAQRIAVFSFFRHPLQPPPPPYWRWAKT